MIAEIIVVVTLVFAAGLTLAWAFSPAVRVWLERPKHTLQDSLLRYDRQRVPGSRSGDAHQS